MKYLVVAIVIAIMWGSVAAMVIADKIPVSSTDPLSIGVAVGLAVLTFIALGILNSD